MTSSDTHPDLGRFRVCRWTVLWVGSALWVGSTSLAAPGFLRRSFKEALQSAASEDGSRAQKLLSLDSAELDRRARKIADEIAAIPADDPDKVGRESLLNVEVRVIDCAREVQDLRRRRTVTEPLVSSEGIEQAAEHKSRARESLDRLSVPQELEPLTSTTSIELASLWIRDQLAEPLRELRTRQTSVEVEIRNRGNELQSVPATLTEIRRERETNLEATRNLEARVRGSVAPDRESNLRRGLEARLDLEAILATWAAELEDHPRHLEQLLRRLEVDFETLGLEVERLEKLEQAAARSVEQLVENERRAAEDEIERRKNGKDAGDSIDPWYEVELAVSRKLEADNAATRIELSRLAERGDRLRSATALVEVRRVELLTDRTRDRRWVAKVRTELTESRPTE